MQYSECPYLNLGDTVYGQEQAIDTADVKGKQLEGREWWFPDTPPTSLLTGGSTPRSNRGRLMRIMRNNSGVTLYAKQLVSVQLSGTNFSQFGQDFDGKAIATAQANCFPIDEYLPNGVRYGDLCWVCIRGPALCKTDRASGATNFFAVGDVLVALTAATTQATTAGRVAPQDVTSSGATLAGQIMNQVGKAMSANLTTQTDNDVLVDIRAP